MKKHEQYWKDYLGGRKKQKEDYFKELDEAISEKKKTYRKPLLSDDDEDSDLVVVITRSIQSNKEEWDSLEEKMKNKFLSDVEAIERNRSVLPASGQEPFNVEELRRRKKFEEDMDGIFISWKFLLNAKVSNIN